MTTRRILRDQDDYVGYMRRLTGTVGAPSDDTVHNLYTSGCHCGDEYVEGFLGHPLPAHLLEQDPVRGLCYLTEDEIIDMIDFKAGNPVEAADNRLLAILRDCLDEMEESVADAEYEAEEKVAAKSRERAELNREIAQLCNLHKRLHRKGGTRAAELNREIGRKCNEHKRLVHKRKFREARELSKEITSMKRELAAEQNSEIAEISRAISEMKARLAVIDDNLPLFRRLMAQAIRLANEHLNRVHDNLCTAAESVFCPEVVVE